jgi:hypothetical protein
MQNLGVRHFPHVAAKKDTPRGHSEYVMALTSGTVLHCLLKTACIIRRGLHEISARRKHVNVAAVPRGPEKAKAKICWAVQNQQRPDRKG